MKRRPPWDYPRETVPSRWTLAAWRRKARILAKAAGAYTACDICKRPMNQFGKLLLKHPRSYGKTRQRILCTVCTNLVMTVVDVLEWHGAEDNLPAETWTHPAYEDPRDYPKGLPSGREDAP